MQYNLIVVSLFKPEFFQTSLQKLFLKVFSLTAYQNQDILFLVGSPYHFKVTTISSDTFSPTTKEKKNIVIKFI